MRSLVEEAHVAAKNAADWDEQAYKVLRTLEKIQMLKSYLPDFLVRNPALYSILSLGIHELTEQKCLANFEALKNGITIILDERIAQRQEAQRIKAAEIAIAKITGARGNV